MRLSVKSNQSPAFTMAEVLLAMLILGIIMLMFVPVLLNKINDRKFLAIFYKTYNEIQSVNSVSRANGEPLYNSETKTWQSVNNDDDFEIYKKYFKMSLMPRKDCLYFNNVKSCEHPRVKELGGKLFNGRIDNAVAFTTPDNALVAFGSWFDLSTIDYTSKNIVYIDVNGTKPPNVLGRDIFLLNYNPFYNQLSPMGGAGTPYENLKTCVRNNSGVTCAYEFVMNREFKIK